MTRVGTICKRWPPEEDRVIFNEYPNYVRILNLLPHRTYESVKGRARTLGVASKRHCWTTSQIKLIAQASARGVTGKALTGLIANVSPQQIRSQRKHHKIKVVSTEGQSGNGRPRHPVVAQIRARMRDLGMTHAQLAGVTGLEPTMFYEKSVCARVAIKAIEALGGDYDIVWKDD